MISWDAADLVMPENGALAADVQDISVAMISKGDGFLLSFSFRVDNVTLPEVEEITRAVAAAIAATLREDFNAEYRPEGDAD